MKLKTTVIKAFLIVLCSFGCAFSVDAQADKKEGKLMEKTAITTSNKSSASNDEEVKNIIVELDTEYQQAVKMNDEAVMNRILADDFVLVTGKGKTYSKADLLKEARDGKTIYERQEDSSQSVRIWGDTAIITALLWAKGISGGKPFE